jgi:hypothetical protein
LRAPWNSQGTHVDLENVLFGFRRPHEVKGVAAKPEPARQKGGIDLVLIGVDLRPEIDRAAPAEVIVPVLAKRDPDVRVALCAMAFPLAGKEQQMSARGERHTEIVSH